MCLISYVKGSTTSRQRLHGAPQHAYIQIPELYQCRRAEELETLREELRAQRAIALAGDAARAEAAAAAEQADAASAEAARERAALAARLAARERCALFVLVFLFIKSLS